MKTEEQIRKRYNELLDNQELFEDAIDELATKTGYSAEQLSTPEYRSICKQAYQLIWVLDM